MQWGVWGQGVQAGHTCAEWEWGLERGLGGIFLPGLGTALRFWGRLQPNRRQLPPTAVSCSSSSTSVGALVDPQITPAGAFFFELGTPLTLPLGSSHCVSAHGPRRPAVLSLMSALVTNTTLVHLHVQRAQVKDYHVDILCTALTGNTTLRCDPHPNPDPDPQVLPRQ